MLRCRWSLLSICVMSGVVVAMSAGPAAAAPLIATPPSCSSSFDMYAYTPTALAACDIKTYPLTSVVPAPSGGEDYEYDLPDGSVEHEYVLPKGFDAATASPALRADYGIMPLPPAGSDPEEVVLWAQSMQHVKFRPPTPYWATSKAETAPFAANPPASGDSYTGYNWSGYATCAAIKTTFIDDCYPSIFTSAAGLYTEPSYASDTSCQKDNVDGTPEPPADLIWAGIGGADPKTTKDPTANTVLAQTGTANAPGLGIPEHGTWYETVPGKGFQLMVQTEFLASPRDQIAAIVDYVNGTYYFEVYDETSELAATASQAGAYTGDSAEMVVERPEVTFGSGSSQTDYLTGLGHFTKPISVDAEANGIWMNNYPATGWRWGLHMEERSTGQDLADPSDISAPDGSFTVDYKSCGGLEQIPSG
jgi:hypothetical protein